MNRALDEKDGQETLFRHEGAACAMCRLEPICAGLYDMDKSYNSLCFSCLSTQNRPQEGIVRTMTIN